MDIIEQSCVLITSGSERLIALVQILHHRISSNYHKQAILVPDPRWSQRGKERTILSVFCWKLAM